MTLYGAVFYLLAAIIVVATGMAVTRRQPVMRCFTSIVAFFLGTAALFFLLGAPLLAAFVVILYAGAIIGSRPLCDHAVQRSPRELGLLSDWGPATLLGVVFFAVAVAMVLRIPAAGLSSGALSSSLGISGGHFLFDRYWLAIENSSPSCSSLPWWPSFIWAREGMRRVTKPKGK